MLGLPRRNLMRARMALCDSVRERSGSNLGVVNALRKLVDLVGESTQSSAGRFGLGPVGKPPQKGCVIVIAQSAFFRLSKHGCGAFC